MKKLLIHHATTFYQIILWLWEDTNVLNVVGSNPSTVYWMDIFSHELAVKIVMFA